MGKLRVASILIFLALLSSAGSQTSFPSYYQRTSWLGTPPVLLTYGLLGYGNPAMARFADNEIMGFWQQSFLSTTNGTQSLQNWLLISAFQGILFSMEHHPLGNGTAYRSYKLGIGGGSNRLGYGISYQWFTGTTAFRPVTRFGILYRPGNFLSLGLQGSWSPSSGEQEAVVEGGIRPFGSPLLTLGGDVQITRTPGTFGISTQYSVSAMLQPVSGISLWGRYFPENDKTFFVGMTLDGGFSSILGHLSGASGTPTDELTRTVGIRFGSYTQPSLDQLILKGKAYTALHLKGTVPYLNYQWYPKSKSPRFLKILQTIRSAAADQRIQLIALNLSGTVISPELGWEIRRELEQFKASGKKVLVYIDNASLSLYHLASVADYLLMDPEGQIEMMGLALSRTYFKHTLEKLGLGFEEHRFFKYKSALESYARDRMSDADREQLQAYLDDWYALIRSDVSKGRDLSPAQFDAIVNDKALVLAREAQTLGLVDTLVRWSAVDEWVKQHVDDGLQYLPASMVEDVAASPRGWETRPVIAVVYGLGICAMDEGIRARYLEQVFLKLRNRSDVKAVVFRVDSPGGDPMASDVVAAAIARCREKKPVIISQGQVAGSGGYWISMNGTKIVAGPNTVTGSIGVIGGWLWDKGFAARLGMSSDHVQVGRHADLLTGVRLPVLGIQIPTRNLTEAEKARLKTVYFSIYDTFVAKVSKGRSIPEKRVREIAEGRIYSGVDGKAVQLVDEIGTLMDAIDLAKELAGISSHQPVKIVEFPAHMGTFKLPSFSLNIRSQVTADPTLRLISFLARFNGKPLPLLLPGYYPAAQ